MAMKPTSVEKMTQAAAFLPNLRVFWALGMRLETVSPDPEKQTPGVTFGETWTKLANMDRFVPQFDEAAGVKGLMRAFRSESAIVRLVNDRMSQAVATMLPKWQTLDDPTAVIKAQQIAAQAAKAAEEERERAAALEAEIAKRDKAKAEEDAERAKERKELEAMRKRIAMLEKQGGRTARR